jgi:hypothetical protein
MRINLFARIPLVRIFKAVFGISVSQPIFKPVGRKGRGARCPACGSTDIAPLDLEDGKAMECLRCSHWGYVH